MKSYLNAVEQFVTLSSKSVVEVFMIPLSTINNQSAIIDNNQQLSILHISRKSRLYVSYAETRIISENI